MPCALVGDGTPLQLLLVAGSRSLRGAGSCRWLWNRPGCGRPGWMAERGMLKPRDGWRFRWRPRTLACLRSEQFGDPVIQKLCQSALFRPMGSRLPHRDGGAAHGDRWPRSQREQMSIWRGHRTHRNSRASSIAPLVGEGWTVRDHQAILKGIRRDGNALVATLLRARVRRPWLTCAPSPRWALAAQIDDVVEVRRFVRSSAGDMLESEPEKWVRTKGKRVEADAENVTMLGVEIAYMLTAQHRKQREQERDSRAQRPGTRALNLRRTYERRKPCERCQRGSAGPFKLRREHEWEGRRGVPKPRNS